MRELELVDGGETAGVVVVDGNSVETQQFAKESLENTFADLDGMTGYRSEEPTREVEGSHIDKIVPMEEPQVVANVKMVAAVNALDVKSA